MVDLIWRCSTLSRFKFCFCYIVLQNGRSTKDGRIFWTISCWNCRCEVSKWRQEGWWRCSLSRENRWGAMTSGIWGWQVCSDFCQSMWTRWAANWQVHTMAIITRHCDYAQICSNMLKSFMSAMGHQEPSSLSSKQCDTLLAPVAPEGYSFRSLTSPKKRIASRSKMLPHGNDTMI